MKRLFHLRFTGSNGWRGVRGGFHFTGAIFCLVGIAAVTRLYATQEGGRQEAVQQGASAKTSTGPGSARTKVAEGEYAIFEEGNGGAFGPFGEEVYDFHESWTLWRVEKGQYAVEGERKFEAPRYTPHANHFIVELSRDKTATRITEFAPLRWRRDSGPLSCEFLIKEVHCSAAARDPQKSIDLRIPMGDPFALLWPISPFSLGSLARQSERDPVHGTPVQLVSIEQPSPSMPIDPVTLSGQLQYLGEENIEAAGQKWPAHKFSLKIALHPQVLMWTSSNGLLLALSIEHPHPNWPQEGLKLVRFKKWADF